MNLLKECLDIFARSVVSVVALFIFAKIMGTKQISQLTFYDYIIGISIGSAAAAMAVDHQISYIGGIIAIATYAAFATLISISTTKSITLRRIFTGTPYIIVNKGQIVYDNLKKSKLDTNDFLLQARAQGYFDLSQIEYAILESSGKISFMLKSENRPVTPIDMALSPPQEKLMADVIIDSKIMYQNLSTIGKDEKWLSSKLVSLNKNIKNIVLCITDGTDIHVFEKNYVESKNTSLE
jgi:uncharacterized membrane protein YcaP (DUF421 family)